MLQPLGGRMIRNALALAGLAVVTGCATPPTDPAQRQVYDQTNDPLEPTNRRILDFNMWLDRNAIRPAAVAYVDTVPEPGRRGIHNILQNLSEPIVFANKVVQLDFGAAATSFGRFVVNSTFGIGGIFDVMADDGHPRPKAGDFGATLAHYGVGEGPYLVLPVFGPSNPRDAVGMAADGYADPFQLYLNSNVYSITTGVVGGIDRRAGVLGELDDLQRNSLDFYAQLRSVTRQHRRYELGGAGAPSSEDLYADPASPAPLAPKPQ